MERIESGDKSGDKIQACDSNSSFVFTVFSPQFENDYALCRMRFSKFLEKIFSS